MWPRLAGGSLGSRGDQLTRTDTEPVTGDERWFAEIARVFYLYHSNGPERRVRASGIVSALEPSHSTECIPTTHMDGQEDSAHTYPTLH